MPDCATLPQVWADVRLKDVLGDDRCACCAGPVVLAGSLYCSVRAADGGYEELQDRYAMPAHVHHLSSLREACWEQWAVHEPAVVCACCVLDPAHHPRFSRPMNRNMRILHFVGYA